MSLSGTGALSIRKRDLSTQKSVAVGFKELVFAHKALAGETGISVGSLTVPLASEMPGFVQPSFTDITAANMRFFRDNVEVISSSKGQLIDRLSYDVASSTQINFVGFTADASEIFVVKIREVARTGLRVVDANPIIATGIVLAGSTDFNVGTPFEVGKYINAQVGAVTVYVDGVQQYRNPANGTSGGNYQEIAASNDGLGTIISLNSTTGFDRNLTVISTGLMVEKPELSQLAEIESSQGQIDAMIPTLALLAGVAETEFQAAPNNINLKQFGDRVVRLETYRSVATGSPLAARTANSPVDRVLFDTTSGGGTLVLPLTPSIGTWVEIWDPVGIWGTNTMTIDRNGELIEGVAADFTVSTDNVKLKFVYVSSARGWIISNMT